MIHLTLPNGRIHDIPTINYEIVYDRISEFLCDDPAEISATDHLIASDAEGWTELAACGEHYEDRRLPGLTIDIY